jgi:hypothetical protein
MNVVTVFIGTIIIGVLLSAVLSLPVWWLWNKALVGAITGVNEITWLQAWGISILCSFLFKPSITKSES